MSKSRSKPKTLDSVWKLCLEMWKYVSSVYELAPSVDVHKAKGKWLEMNGFDRLNFSGDCFFCDWAGRKGQDDLYPSSPGRCEKCPGVKVSEEFACQLEGTDWRHNPVEFYQLLVKLNKKHMCDRKKKRK